eukprot:COSAG05_NODE_60_length_23142_cov_25.372130_23_plen_78_part_00
MTVGLLKLYIINGDNSFVHSFICCSVLCVQAYSYSCLTAVPTPGLIGLAYETVLPGSAIKAGASANNIVFTLVRHGV